MHCNSSGPRFKQVEGLIAGFSEWNVGQMLSSIGLTRGEQCDDIYHYRDALSDITSQYFFSVHIVDIVST